MISAETKLIALIGNPVRHSLSPLIQNYFIKKYLLDVVYLAFEFEEEDLEEAFNGAKKLGFLGLNVTMPYKNAVFKLVDRPDDVSKIIKSVNTVKFDKENKISEGYNTDVKGFISSLDEKSFKWKQSSCLVIGAGGAARGAIYGLLKKEVKDIWVYNRTVEKIHNIIKDLKNEGSGRIHILNNINDLDDKIDGIDLILNCTPLGMDTGEDTTGARTLSYKDIMPVPDSWNLGDKFVFDMVYKPSETLLLKKAKKEGAVIIKGIDLLISQAAYSFEIWTGITPESEYIEEIKRKVLINIENMENNELKY
jgi:shikimate dehydrogenase